MDPTVDIGQKLDTLTRILEEMHESQLRAKVNQSHIFRDLVLTTVCGSIIGYFLYKVLDAHLEHHHEII